MLLELAHILRPPTFLEAQSMPTKFYDSAVYFMFIIHHVIGNFVGNGLII